MGRVNVLRLEKQYVHHLEFLDEREILIKKPENSIHFTRDKYQCLTNMKKWWEGRHLVVVHSANSNIKKNQRSHNVPIPFVKINY